MLLYDVWFVVVGWCSIVGCDVFVCICKEFLMFICFVLFCGVLCGLCVMLLLVLFVVIVCEVLLFVDYVDVDGLYVFIIVMGLEV